MLRVNETFLEEEGLRKNEWREEQTRWDPTRTATLQATSLGEEKGDSHELENT